VAGNLLESEVLILTWAIEDYIANRGRNLRHANAMSFEVAEHFVGWIGHRMALDAATFPKKDHGPFLLIFAQRAFCPSSKLIDGGIGTHYGEFELCYGGSKHI